MDIDRLTVDSLRDIATKHDVQTIASITSCVNNVFKTADNDLIRYAVEERKIQKDLMDILKKDHFGGEERDIRVPRSVLFILEQLAQRDDSRYQELLVKEGLVDMLHRIIHHKTEGLVGLALEIAALISATLGPSKFFEDDFSLMPLLELASKKWLASPCVRLMEGLLTIRCPSEADLNLGLKALATIRRQDINFDAEAKRCLEAVTQQLMHHARQFPDLLEPELRRKYNI